MGSHYVYNIVPYIHGMACGIIYGLQILDLLEMPCGWHVNLKKSISDIYAGLKVYDTVITIHSRI
jgi:hypothetical protein